MSTDEYVRLSTAVDLGDGVCEHEAKTGDHTTYWPPAEAETFISGQALFVLGQKGQGKTAFSRHVLQTVRERDHEVVDLTLNQALPWSQSDLETFSTVPEGDMRQLWRVLLLLTTVKVDELPRTTQDILSRSGLATERVTLTRQLAKLARSMRVEASYEGFSVAVDPTETPGEDAVDDRAAAVRRIAQAERALRPLVKEQPFLLLDRFDALPPAVLLNLLPALTHAAADLHFASVLTVIIPLRSDVWQSRLEQGFPEHSHVSGLRHDLIWSSEDVWHIVRLKLRDALQRCEQDPGLAEGWLTHLFPAPSDLESILADCDGAVAPRDAILVTNAILKRQARRYRRLLDAKKALLAHVEVVATARQVARKIVQDRVVAEHPGPDWMDEIFPRLAGTTLVVDPASDLRQALSTLRRCRLSDPRGANRHQLAPLLVAGLTP